MKTMNKAIIAVSISIALSACGGNGGSDGGSSSAAKAHLKGTAIDGYVTGATAFLDVNYNGKHDAGEPSGVTGEDGEWELLMSGTYAECSQYVPTVVHVPVGAIDSDYGEVTEAYDMTYPPSFAIDTNEQLMNTTPLTTVVWSTIQAELQEAGEVLTCDNVKNSYEVRNRIKERLDEQEFRVAQRYNVTVDELYSDYIVDGNDTLHQQAAALVPSMQKSYADTVALEAANPNALLAWVEYFNGEWDERGHYPAGWYKETYINNGDTQGWTSVTQAVSDDLATVNETVGFYNGTKQTVNGLTYEWTNQFIKNTERTTCIASEWIEQDAATSYGVKNVFELSLSDATACENVNWADHTDTVKQQLTTRIETASSNTTSQHFFNSTTDTGLGHLVLVNPANVAASELDGVNFISTDFNNTNAYGAAFWSRIQTLMNPSAGIAQRTTSHNETGTWSRTTTFENGTYSEQCSYDNGANWSAKTGDTCAQ